MAKSRVVLRVVSRVVARAAKILIQEKVRPVSICETELKFLVSEAVVQKLEELRNLVGNESLATLFENGIDALLRQEKKKRGFVQKTQPAGFREVPKSNPYVRYIPMSIKKEVFKNSSGQCEYVDKNSKRRCQSRYRLQIDHRVPYVLGGKTEVSNLRHLCFAHNQWMAKKWNLQKPTSKYVVTSSGTASATCSHKLH